MSASSGTGDRRHLDRRRPLGGDHSLRGHLLRCQAGTGRWRFAAKQRVFTSGLPLQRFNVDSRALRDVGATRIHPDAPPPELLEGNRGSIRLGNNRSALGNVRLVALIVTVAGDSSINSARFLTRTRRS